MSMGCLGDKEIYRPISRVCFSCRWRKDCMEIVEGKNLVEEQQYGEEEGD